MLSFAALRVRMCIASRLVMAACVLAVAETIELVRLQ